MGALTMARSHTGPRIVQACLGNGAIPRAPTLRELQSCPDQPVGQRAAALAIIRAVPANHLLPLEQYTRVLRCALGIRLLIAVFILERPATPGEPARQVSRPVILDTGGIDGRQAWLRREIARLHSCKERYQELIHAARKAQAERAKPLPAHYAGWKRQVAECEPVATPSWLKYTRRNKELAHLAANLLLLLATRYTCGIIVGESLATRQGLARGSGMRRQLSNRQHTFPVRGELWRVLSYKCAPSGIRARTVTPPGTTDTSPQRHQPAHTCVDPAQADRKKARDCGPWLCCKQPGCRWNGARDDAARLTIAALCMAFRLHSCQTPEYSGMRRTSPEVKPCSYSGRGGAPLLRLSGGSHPALQRANTSALPVGPHLTLRLAACLNAIQRLPGSVPRTSGNACSCVHSVRLVQLRGVSTVPYFDTVSAFASCAS